MDAGFISLNHSYFPPQTSFRAEMTTKAADPFSVVLRRKKIPMGLLVDSAKAQRMNLLETEAFKDTFGGKVCAVDGCVCRRWDWGVGSPRLSRGRGCSLSRSTKRMHRAIHSFIHQWPGHPQAAQAGRRGGGLRGHAGAGGGGRRAVPGARAQVRGICSDFRLCVIR